MPGLESHVCSVYFLCMATKTISLRLEAYERLKRARRTPNESFSDVVMRARWPDVGLTGGDLLALYERRGPYLSEEALDRIEDAKSRDRPPEDKWTKP
jgi:hypothetical protein